MISPSKPSKAEVALRDAEIDRLRENGMEVITDVAEGQRGWTRRTDVWGMFVHRQCFRL